MIFLTLGMQLPFPRLVKAMDNIAETINEPIFGQIGQSDEKPLHYETVESLAPLDFAEKINSARLIVSHAGIGTILSAQRAKKSIILMPRLATLGEHRNDHQIATCNQLKHYSGIYIASSEDELHGLITDRGLVAMSPNESSKNRNLLIENLQKILFS